jgi:replicative DNA helicase
VRNKTQPVVQQIDIEQIEYALIAELITNSEIVTETIAKLSSDAFKSEDAKKIYETIDELNRREIKISIHSIVNYIEANAINFQLNVKDFLNKIIMELSSLGDCDHYIELIKLNHAQRMIRKIGEEMTNVVLGQLSSSNQMKEYIDKITEIQMGLQCKDNSSNLAEIGKQFFEYANKVINREIKDNSLKTNFHKLDKYTGGFKENNLVIIGARPGGGKTALSLNLLTPIAEAVLSENIYLADKNIDEKQGVVIYFSLEMNKREMYQRLLSAAINKKVDVADSTFAQYKTHYEAKSEKLNSLPILLVDSTRITIDEMITICRKKSAEYNIKAIFIDYLQIIEASKKTANYKNRANDVGFNARGCKQMARDFKCPVFALAQVSRNDKNTVVNPNSKDQKPPDIKLSDLRESGDIENEADFVIFIQLLNNPSDTEVVDNVRCEINIAKNRSGQIGKIPFN